MKRKAIAVTLGICTLVSAAAAAGVSAQEIYYDDAGTPYFYDENGYIFYYDENGDIYYYDENGNIYYTTGGLEGTITEDGAGSAETAYEEPVSQDSDDQTVQTEAQREPKERETADENGQIHSYLTGKLTDEAVVLHRPYAVMINNIQNAIPQAGISKASVIYEAPVEGYITRLMAIFEDVADLEKIGPVRSCRDYYIDFALEFDAFYTHFGQAVYAYDLLNSEMVNNISGLQYQDGVGEIYGYAGEDIFFRTDDRPAPHNCYTSETGLKTAVERKGYDTALDDAYEGHFKFASDGETVTYTDGTATHIVPHQYTNHPSFEYDAESQKYLRFQYPDESGAERPQIDEMNGEQLSADNVIIQYCESRPYDDNGYLDIDTNSGGDAVLFTKGTYQKATWEKATEWGPARYYDAQGNEIAVNQGTTWVCIVENTKKDDTSFE